MGPRSVPEGRRAEMGLLVRSVSQAIFKSSRKADPLLRGEGRWNTKQRDASREEAHGEKGVQFVKMVAHRINGISSSAAGN